MWDAVNPANIPAEVDGSPALRITVLADEAGEAFDLEADNAPASEVAAAMASRLSRGLWSVGYVNGSTFHDLWAAMGPKGLSWAEADQWPKPGIYLWAADPDGNIAKGAWPVPVRPLAVQDHYEGPRDSSTTADNFPAGAAGYIDGPQSEWPAAAWSRFTVLPEGGTNQPAPAPKPEPAPAPTPQKGTCKVMLPVLTEGATGRSVEAVQKIVGHVATDGIFGPVTLEAVRQFQEANHLAVDGIVGQHTWGALLGSPQ